MKRREFIAVLGGTAAWPLAARAQQSAMPVIGFLSGRSPGEAASAVDAFRQGLGEIGYIEGQNVTIEYRWAEGHYDRLPALAAELVARQVAVIAATGGEASGLARDGDDPDRVHYGWRAGYIAARFVEANHKPKLDRIVTFIVGDIATKRLGLLRQLVPNATTIAMLVNPNYPATSAEVRDVQAAARTIGLEIDLLPASTSREIDAALTTFVRKRPAALFVG